MSDVKLVANVRTNSGKGAARQARREGKIPAVVYSHGGEAKSILVSAHEAFLAIKNHRHALISLDIDGADQKAIIKDVQKDAIGRVIEHIDFLAVKAGEKQTVEVPVVIVGDTVSGTLPTLELHNVSIEADVSSLPGNLEVNVEGLDAGTIIHIKDIELPAGQTVINDPEQVVVVVAQEQQEDADEVAEETEPAAE